MSVKWQLIRMRSEPDSVYGECTSDFDTQRTIQALERQGIEYGVNTIKDLFTGNDLALARERTVIPFSTISAVREMSNRYGWLNWAPMERLKCSVYYSHVPQWIAQQDYFFLPAYCVLYRWEELVRLVGKNGEMFIRPDNNTKSFTGCVINKKGMSQLLEGIDPAVMCLIARPLEIIREWRCFFRQGKFITSSIYWPEEERREDECPLSDEWYQEFFAQCCESNYDLPEVIHLDFARIQCPEGWQMKLLEITAVSCAGLYEMDRDRFVKEMTEQAELEYGA